MVRDSFHSQEGSGSLLAVAVVGAVLTMAAMLIPALAILSASQSVQNAADAAALAAADTASGAIPGVPCESASSAARMNEAALDACALDGLIASVSVSRSVGAFLVSSTARAGPPGS